MSTPSGAVKPAYFRLGAVVAAVIVVVFALDRLLATVERVEIQRGAREQFEAGMLLLRAGRKDSALGPLERAHALARTNREYSLGLIEALIANGSRDEAEARLREILNADSNDGRANLLFARLLAHESRTDEAIAFYHRAIYGIWHDPGAETDSVRLELARYLATTHRPRELLSELLLLQGRGSKDIRMTTDLAGLFLVAGSGPRAAEMYRAILQNSPEDAGALRGLGEANLLAGDYRTAESVFLRALRLHPADAEIIHRLHFANTLAMLDPTSRRLGSQAKFDRATALVSGIRSELAQCPSAASSPLLEEADQAVTAKVHGPVTNDIAEARLSLAEKLWELRKRTCSAPVNADTDPVSLVMQKILNTQ
ncbi:MAG: tetratricopeptide repeat protein [Terriglobia bacterium]